MDTVTEFKDLVKNNTKNKELPLIDSDNEEEDEEILQIKN